LNFNTNFEKEDVFFCIYFPKNAEDLALMQMVVKENSSRVIADILFDHDQKNARFFPGFGLSR
jgi:hypothetical protein